jgi:hypothetical protein
VAWLVLSVFLGGSVPAGAEGAAGAGVQEYLLPGTQNEMLGVFNRLLEDIYGPGKACVSTEAGACVGPSNDLSSVIESRTSIVAYADRSVVLLDVAGNGFESGYDPEAFDGAYDLDRGQVLTLAQDGTVQRAGQPGPEPAGLPLVGGDRVLTVGGPVLVMRAAWPRWVRFPTEWGFGVSTGRILGECLTLYPTGAWGTGYGTPMGVSAEDDPLHVDDRTTLALVQAKEDGTEVALNGTPVGTLARGGSLLLDAVPVGALIGGSRPISVALLTSGREQVDVRAFNLTPPALLDSTYVLPANSTAVGSDRALGLRLYLYAYEALDYGVYQGEGLVAGGSLAGLGATAVHAVDGPTEIPVPEADPDPGPESAAPLPGGVRVVASGRLQVLVAFDSDRPDWDWGFPLVGGRHLANEYFLPWAPARGPAWPEPNVGGYLGYGQPLHVSPAHERTEIFADWDPWLGNGAEVSVILEPGEWATLVDPFDGDNTGAHLYGVRVDGEGAEDVGPTLGPPEGAFALAWGEGILADLADGYDLGYGLLPSKAGFFEEPLLDLVKVVEPESVSPGDEIHVTLSLSTASEEVTGLSVTETLPGEDFHYVRSSTSIHYPDGTVASGAAVDPVSADGLTLAWELDGELPPGSQLILTFRVVVAGEYSRPLPDVQVNTAEARGEWCPFESRPCFELRPTAFDNVRVEERTGTVKVWKRVRWRGSRPDEGQTFTLCVRPVGAGDERCQDVDWDGGVLVFRDLPAGRWEVYEKDLDESTWRVRVQPRFVEVHGRCRAAWAKVVNTHRRGGGSLKVRKVVNWRGTPPDPDTTFALCVRGPSYREPSLENGGCRPVGPEGGRLSWEGLERGRYLVYEDPLPGPEWRVVGSGQQVWVGRGCRAGHGCEHGEVVIKNLRKRLRGKIVVKKRIDWNGFTPEPVVFPICVVGPAPATTRHCQTIHGSGRLVFRGLAYGTYTVAEEPGEGWEATIEGSPVQLSRHRRHRVARAKVTNRRVEASRGRLEVTKTLDLGSLPGAGRPFEICIEGPAPSAARQCQLVDAAGGTVSFEDLVAGTYTVTETEPGREWVVSRDPADGRVAVPAGGTGQATIENRRARGNLLVTTIVNWNGVAPVEPAPEFTVCLTGPDDVLDVRPGPQLEPYPGDCQVTSGGDLTWTDLKAADYVIQEYGFGAEWQVDGIPGLVKVLDGETATWTLTNTYQPGGGIE